MRVYVLFGYVICKLNFRYFPCEYPRRVTNDKLLLYAPLYVGVLYVVTLLKVSVKAFSNLTHTLCNALRVIASVLSVLPTKKVNSFFYPH